MKRSVKTLMRSLYILSGFALFWVVINLFSFSYTVNENDKEHQKEFNNNYAVYALVIPEELDFAGEKVPLDYFDVRESIDREFLVNTYWQSQTLLFFKRSNKYFPIIEPILKENGVPDDFKYLALAESGLMNVVSPAGATGFWQFMKGTGKEYGLEINSEIDERYHLEKSTKAACDYLNDAYKKYNNWTLVAASYNMGMGGLDKQLKRQKVDNYYDLLLNIETSRYVYRILAIKTILTNPDKHGFHFREKDLYFMPETYEVEIDSAVANFADFAAEHKTNYKILKAFNPWLRQSFLTNKNSKKYTVKIPKEGARSIDLDAMDDTGSMLNDSTLEYYKF